MNLVIEDVKSKIVQIETKPPYQLDLTMNNGEKVQLDLTPLIEKRTAFWRLKNFRYFRQVSVDPLGGVCWTEGEDISPCKIFDYVKSN
jgi:hypothetical protein